MFDPDPTAIDPVKFAELMDVIADHPDDCACTTCTFIDLIPAILDAEGVEP